jgi:alcohol dehydrogenase
MWTFKIPTEIVFGMDSSQLAAERAGQMGNKPVLAVDPGLTSIDAFQPLIGQFGGTSHFTDIEPNPTVDNVNALASLITAEKADVLIALGGGSTMDCAKAACCLAASGDSHIQPYHQGEKKIQGKGIPLIAIPTTAGTGSEVTPFSVLDDPASGRKAPLASDHLYPDLALVDPGLTLTLPKKITAATALDALSHAIEGYWSRNHQPICDLLAIEAARLIFTHLEKALRDGNSRESRSGLMQAALLAGLAFQLPKNAFVHACSFPLSCHCGLSHGEACAFTLEYAIQMNAPHMGGRMEAFAEGCGFDSIEAMTGRIRDLKILGGLPCSLEDAGIDAALAGTLIKESFHPLMNNNPKTVTEEDVAAFYATAGSST